MDKFKELEDYAKENEIPIIEKDGLEIIIKILKENKVSNVLEIGSAIGYSALSFNEYAKVKVDSIEREQKMYEIAMRNIENYQRENDITIYHADALEFDEESLDKYDCVYIDAAKAQYKSFLYKYEKCLKEGGIVLFDNLLFHGYVYEKSNEEKSKSFKQMISKIKDFIEYVEKNPKYDFDFIKKGDGIGVLKLNKNYNDSMKKLTITHHSLETTKQILKSSNSYIKMINIGANQFGLRQSTNATIEEIEEVSKLAKLYDIQTYVMCNKLLHEKDLVKIEKYLRKLEKIKVDGIVFSDLAVAYLVEQLDINLEMMYSTETTITNKHFTDLAKDNKIKIIELAKEITASEINEIGKEKKSEISVYIHGHLYMYQSVRKMVDNFANVQNIDLDSNEEDYYLYDDERDNYYPLIQNNQGTHLLAAKDLCMINKLDKLNITDIDYLKIDGYRYSKQEYIKIVELYAEALKEIETGSYNEVKKYLLKHMREETSKEYFTGFFFKQTLY